MDSIIEFQGNKYKLLEEGIYEATGEFLLDNDDWAYGDHPEMVIACKVVGGQPYMWLLSYSWKFENRLREIAYANTKDTINIATRPDMSVNTLGGLFL